MWIQARFTFRLPHLRHRGRIAQLPIPLLNRRTTHTGIRDTRGVLRKSLSSLLKTIHETQERDGTGKAPIQGHRSKVLTIIHTLLSRPAGTTERNRAQLSRDLRMKPAPAALREEVGGSPLERAKDKANNLSPFDLMYRGQGGGWRGST